MTPFAVPISKLETSSASLVLGRDDPSLDVRRLLGREMNTYKIELDEAQRQMVLLALHKLGVERPGWLSALATIESQLGGQLAWPK